MRLLSTTCALLGTLAFGATACGVAADEDLTTDEIAAAVTPPPFTIDPCRTAPADDTINVGGSGQDFFVARPGSGGYFYRSCGRFVVDLVLTSTGRDEVGMTPLAVDLPSSVNAERNLPGNEIDCAAYDQRQTFYKKNAAGNFEVLGSSIVRGSWAAGACELRVAAGAMTRLEGLYNTEATPETYRVATSIKLRTSGQDVLVRASRTSIAR